MDSPHMKCSLHEVQDRTILLFMISKDKKNVQLDQSNERTSSAFLAEGN